MSSNQKISEILGAKRPMFSVEFFPPKTEEGARQILRTAKKLCEVAPDYVSITYGAGGSTRERTLDYGELLRDIFDFDVMPHLACIGHSRDQIDAVLTRIKKSGFRNVFALRGDKPRDATDFVPAPDGFKHASELITYIKSIYPDFGIGCACYPEKHPEASSLDSDILWLKHKIDCGADFAVTQMFFDNSHFFRFLDKCSASGIEKPIVAGLLPALSLKQVQNFRKMCSTEIPDALVESLAVAPTDADARKIGVEWAARQIDELISNGVAGIHLYILNRAESALELSGIIRGLEGGRKQK